MLLRSSLLSGSAAARASSSYTTSSISVCLPSLLCFADDVAQSTRTKRYYSGGAAVEPVSSPPVSEFGGVLSGGPSAQPSIDISPECVEAIKKAQNKVGMNKFLRVGVATGGCLGFKYDIGWDDKLVDDDLVLTKDGVKVVVSGDSLPFVSDGTLIHFERSLKHERFTVEGNKKVASKCGCNSSISVVV